MAYGLQVFDGNGNTLVGENTLLWRYHSSQTGSGGTFTVSGMANDGNWYVVATPNGTTSFPDGFITINTGSFTHTRTYSGGSYRYDIFRKGGSPSTQTGYGLLTYGNASGDVQVDPSYANYVLLASGNNHSPTSTSLATDNGVFLPSGLTLADVIVLIRPSGTTGAVGHITPGISGSSYDLTQFVVRFCRNTTYGPGATPIATTTGNSGTFDYRIYGPANLSTTSTETGYGLNTYNSNGDLIFSSALGYLTYTGTTLTSTWTGNLANNASPGSYTSRPSVTPTVNNRVFTDITGLWVQSELFAPVPFPVGTRRTTFNIINFTNTNTVQHSNVNFVVGTATNNGALTVRSVLFDA